MRRKKTKQTDVLSNPRFEVKFIFLVFCFVQNYNFSQSDGAASATVIVVVAATAAVAATIIVVVVAIACCRCCCVQILVVVLFEQKLETPPKPV